MASHPFQALEFERLEPDSQLEASRAFLARMAKRRTVRDLSDEPAPFELIENAIRAASLAPSGANQQPWRFVVVEDAAIKRQIREAAEAEERENYENRFPEEWLQALAPLGTDWNKPFEELACATEPDEAAEPSFWSVGGPSGPAQAFEELANNAIGVEGFWSIGGSQSRSLFAFLETAPYLIVVFRIDYGIDPAGSKIKHYYVQESVGIACGFLIAGLHLAGLATLTHTPSPMGFLAKILDRPANERPFLLIPAGYPAADAQVPGIGKKTIGEVLIRK